MTRRTSESRTANIMSYSESSLIMEENESNIHEAEQSPRLIDDQASNVDFNRKLKWSKLIHPAILTIRPVHAHRSLHKGIELSKFVELSSKLISAIFILSGHVDAKVKMRKTIELEVRKLNSPSFTARVLSPTFPDHTEMKVVVQRSLTKSIKLTRRRITIRARIIEPTILAAVKYINTRLLKTRIEVKNSETVNRESVIAESTSLNSELITRLDVTSRVLGVVGELVGFDKPVLVLLKLPYGCYRRGDCRLAVSGLIARVLGELYRINTGGVAQTILCRGRLSDCLLLGHAAGKIVIVSPQPNESLFDEKELLRDRVAELAYQGYGFLVIVLPGEGQESELNSVVPYERFVAWPYVINSTAYGVAAVTIDLSDAGPGELARLAQLVLGLQVKDSMPGGRIDDWDQLGKLMAFYDGVATAVLKRIVEQMQAEVAVGGNEESLTHYAGKAIVVKLLRSSVNVVETEKVEGDIVVDVYLETKEGKKVAVEVETFYQRPLVVRRLVDLVETRLKQGFDELWIVVPPLQALILAKQLRRFVQWVRDKGYEDRVKVLTYVVGVREGKGRYSIALTNALRYARYPQRKHIGAVY